MSDPYGKVKGGRLTFKGGIVASRPSKTIDKNKKKKKNKKIKQDDAVVDPTTIIIPAEEEEAGGNEIYTIDAAKKMKYEELFPVETKKFGYEPKKKENEEFKSVEDALDDRVKKKADRYCK